MTKKSEKAQKVADNKRAAWFKKMRSLTGHIFTRLDVARANAAYEHGDTAEAYAFALASQEPVGRCLFPMKAAAVAQADQAERNAAYCAIADLAAKDWDMERAAPWPNSRTMNSFQYEVARDKAKYYGMISKPADGRGYRNHEIVKTDLRIIDEEGIERAVRIARDQTAGSYDAFVIKLVAKVGEVVDATIEGSHIWGNSVLTVTKTDSIERWHTQQIWNRSVLGKEFPQWPSRLMKV